MNSALVLTPEAPYPPVGGGPLRAASLVEYLRQRYAVEAIVFREPGAPEPHFPPEIRAHVLELPYHSRATPARAWRNALRAVRGVPPLVDRFSGFDLSRLLGNRTFDVCFVEHFWCAPYAEQLRPHVRRLVLNLYDVESVLLARCATAERGVKRLLLQRFASACSRLERRWLPAYDDVLVTSEADLRHVPGAIIYPNTIPPVPRPVAAPSGDVAFSGNLEYLPNQTAVDWFQRAIWPHVQAPRWRLIGRNEAALRAKYAHDPRMVFTGPVADAIQELASASVAVVPVRSGSGTRVKIIEAWAAGIPVVSTTVGAEGLPYVDGESILLADSAAEFARAVNKVLTDPLLARRLADNGRRVYELRLTWPVAWEALRNSGF